MNTLRPTLFVLMLALALLAAVWALSMIGSFFTAAADYGNHHEVTETLCLFLAAALVSLGLALSGTAMLEKSYVRTAWSELAQLTVPALMAFGAWLLFVNETFYSLFDPKGFPVHPTETFIYPDAGWHGMLSHLLAAMLVFLGFGALWLALRKEKEKVENQPTGGDGTN